MDEEILRFPEPVFWVRLDLIYINMSNRDNILTHILQWTIYAKVIFGVLVKITSRSSSIMIKTTKDAFLWIISKVTHWCTQAGQMGSGPLLEKFFIWIFFWKRMGIRKKKYFEPTKKILDVTQVTSVTK